MVDLKTEIDLKTVIWHLENGDIKIAKEILENVVKRHDLELSDMLSSMFAELGGNSNEA
jgi:hypothetical protein